MNQGRLEVVKQEMASVKIEILGIRELNWTGMGELISDNHYIYYCGQESLGRNGVAIMVNKRVRNAVLRYNLKDDRMVSVRFHGKPLQYSCLENPMNSMKRQNDRILKEELPRLVGAHLLQISGEITPERRKGWSHRKNNTQLWV